MGSLKIRTTKTIYGMISRVKYCLASKIQSMRKRSMKKMKMQEARRVVAAAANILLERKGDSARYL